MKRLLVLLILSISGIAILAWLQLEVVTHGAGGNRFVSVLIWALGGSCLTLLLLVLNRLLSHTQRLEQAVRERTQALLESEQQLREDAARREEAEAALQRRTLQAEALVRTAARLNAQFGESALLNTICEETARVLEMPVAAILLYDAAREQLRMAASVGLPPQTASPGQLPLAWFRQHAGEARQPFLVNDLAEEEQTPLVQALVSAGFRTLVFVELVYRQRLVGLLLASVLDKPRRVGEEELKLMSGLGDQAAQAITNANLFRALRRLVQRTQRQKLHMQRIMDTVPDGLLVLSQELRLLMANPAGRRILAVLAPEQRQGAPLFTLGGQDTSALLNASTKNETWCELRPPGEERAETAGDAEPAMQVFEATARAMEEGETGIGGAWIVVIRDITSDRQRRQAAQSQDRLATIGQLASGIAHDFNNIMAVITLYSQSLERNPDFPKRREYLATISEQAQQASALIGQIVDFSRSEVVDHGRLDLLPFVKEIVKLLQRTLPESISVSLQADAGEYEVGGNPALLRQMLLNLALNARDAMPEGGELQISLAALALQEGERAPVRGMAAGRYICLSVADTGEGMTTDVQRHLFEPFFSTKRASKGTGMGLAQVYGVVTQHSGEVEVDSRPGRGSRFTIYLPALQAQAIPERAAPARPARQGRAVTILLAEDHEPTRDAIGDTLELLGYNVLAATTGREALAMFDARPGAVDLVLSDMVMPEMGGVELYRELMARDAHLKMIVMTGYPLEQEGRLLLEQGIVDWIRKPFSPDDLAEKIVQMLGNGE